MTGKIEGLIFRNWTYCDKLPDDGKLVGYGLDFGFTNDPTAVVKVKKYDGELWIDLVLYENRLTNPDIYERLKDEIGRVEVIADSAEPKSIQELNNLGLNVYGALKGADSIKNSIDILKRYKMNVTRSSSYLIKELNSYKYKMDKVTGNAINEPVDFMNHAIDALRYLALNKLAEDNSGVYNISFA
jgi:phage terminase large subunit